MKSLFLTLITLLLFAVTVNAQFIEEKTAAIDSVGSLSNYIDTEGKSIAHIDIPSSWTAANITFKTSADTTSANFKDVVLWDGTELTVTVTAGKVFLMNPQYSWAFKRYVKVRSGTSATPVNQADARSVLVGIK